MLERVKVPTMSRLVAATEGEDIVRRVPYGSDARKVRAAAEIVDRLVR